MDVTRWSRDEARAAVAAPDLDRQLGVALGIAAVVVDLGDDPGADLAAVLATLPIVAIARGTAAAAGWDVVVDDPAPVIDGVLAAPHAAVTTAQVLRGTEDRTVGEGLLVESLAYAALQGGPEFAAWLGRRGRRVRTDDRPRVRVEDLGDSVDVVLDRPRLRNLLDARMRDELVEALRALSAGDPRPVALRGEGPAFCAGGDPAEFGTVSDPATAHLLRASANVAPWLHRIAERTTAFVHGPCVGAGVELAAFCGQVVADPDTRFRLPETRMGLLPGAGGTVSIPARIGRHRTLQWLLTDAEIGAGLAFDWGLVDQVEPRARS